MNTNIYRATAKTASALTVSTALILGTAGMASASIALPNRPIIATVSHSICQSNADFSVPDWYTVEDIDAELTLLSNSSDAEQDLLIQASLGQGNNGERIAPLVIMAAIGCAVGVGGAIFNTTWSSASSVAWSLAGALVGCIPGASQAKLVSVILKHKTVIAKALKAVGAVGAASALSGDSPQ